MGKLKNKATDALGLTNNKGERRALAASIAASERASGVAAESLAFQREQYKTWERVFGPVREDVAEYYNNLDANDFLSKALQLQQAGHQTAQKQISQGLAQRGFDDSRFEQYLRTTNNIANATTRAGLRATADDAVAQQKLGFLGIGLGQQQNHLGLINQSFGQGVQANQHTAGVQSSAFHRFASQNHQVKRDLLDLGAAFAGGG